MLMSPKVEAYTYDRTRRYEVKKGTRCVSVVLDIGLKSPANLANTGTRNFFAGEAAKIAASAWMEKWGLIPWDMVTILTSHTTIQVVVEFRVSDE